MKELHFAQQEKKAHRTPRTLFGKLHAHFILGKKKCTAKMKEEKKRKNRGVGERHFLSCESNHTCTGKLCVINAIFFCCWCSSLEFAPFYWHISCTWEKARMLLCMWVYFLFEWLLFFLFPPKGLRSWMRKWISSYLVAIKRSWWWLSHCTHECRPSLLESNSYKS